MQPARLDLSVIQGATFRQILRIMQPELAYRPITAIASTSPVRLSVDHDLPTDWPVWVRGVTGLPALNKEFPRALPHLAQVVDAGHLDINPIAATGLLPKGGELSYYLPVDLSGVDATLLALDASGAELLSLVPTVHAGGWVDVLLTDEQTAALTWEEGNWQLDLAFPNGESYRAFTGKATVYPAGTTPSGQCEGGWVLAAGGQGVPGPMGPAFQVDAFGPLAERDQYDDEEEGFAFLATDNGLLYLREGAAGGWTDGVPFQGPPGEDGRSVTGVAVNGSGHLIISYSDGTTSDAGPVPPAPTLWGSIGGTLLDQTDLANALANKATAAQGALADTAVQPAALAAGLDSKVDKEAGFGLSQENFTAAEKSKLAGLESSHFKGLFADLAALEAAFPAAVAGDYADVDAGVGSDTVRYVWDPSDTEWVPSGSGAPLTAAQIKELYESNPDTNSYSDAEKAKLAGVATDATANPDTDSLAEGSTNQYFTAARVRAVVLTGLSLVTNAAIAAADTVLEALGKLQAQISAHFGAGGGAHADATTAVAGFMSAADKTKLNGVASGATVNDSDANLKNRSNHTGSQAISTVTGLQIALDAKLALAGGTMSGALNEAPSLPLASASTVNIGAAAANTLTISGSVTMTAFDNIAAGAVRCLVFTGSPQITHNATSMILPGGNNLLVAPGWEVTFLSLGSGNWRCIGVLRPVIAARAQRASVQSIISSSFTAANFTSTAFELGGNLHDPSTNNSRITFPEAGVYSITTSAIFATNATGRRLVSMRLNGGASEVVRDDKQAVTSGPTGLCVSTKINVMPGDYLEALYYQDSGAPIDLIDPVITAARVN